MPDRILRHELWESERFLALPTDTDRLIYLRFLSEADDFGNFEGGENRLMRKLDPATQVKSTEAVSGSLERLVGCDLLRRYVHDGKEYFHIPRFHCHRQYKARKVAASPWCDKSTPLGKETRQSSKDVATTSLLHGSDVAQGVGVGAGEGVEIGAGKSNQATLDSARPVVEAPLDCPHLEILELWVEKLPAMPAHDPKMWKGARSDHLRARWRETCANKRWQTENDGLTYFSRLFVYIGKSQFLTGKAKPKNSDDRPFLIELEWLVRPANWAKVHEGKYHPEKPRSDQDLKIRLTK